MVLCPTCAAEVADGHKFCGECGATVAATCPVCGTTATARQKFCGECGTSLRAPLAVPTARAPDAVAERRVVSVLFADLVGFTTLSESRDIEDVRDLLSRYFQLARTTVDRYGGVVEKFIGDAVMAVWGTPVTHEDDTERAVRAALDLVAAVSALGEEAGATDLQLRAGVVTGEVAVTIGATGEGMVAGDAVNTASRVQAAAAPGAVYVDERTRDASAASIAYADLGAHALKGKAEPVALFRAERVVAGAGGQQRVDGLEAAPFTGRERELRVVKELFHATADERRARLVAVTGVPGVGKSRLAWELFKYLDGVAGLALWHVGRCLSYGDGVAYWALAEIVRMRLRVAEADPPEVVVERLRAGLGEYVEDPEDAEWLTARLGVLLGVGDLVAPAATFTRDELFAAWRLFFERLAGSAPVVLVFEDVQWADSGLLDFVEYLLDWSADTALFILTLARPLLADRRPDWASGRPNVTRLDLGPLGDAAMATLVDGLVAGMPEPLRSAIVARAEGVPLYAVETVRMLIDRGVVVPRAGSYVVTDPTRSFDDLEVPASLHAVVAARLDALPDDERRLLADASVLGLSFTRDGLLALQPDRELDAPLASLLRKQVLGVTADPRSPERGHYRFQQALARTVAYGTLSRRDRKARHLAVAGYLAGRPDAVDLAEIVASHYLDAAEAATGDADAAELRVRGRDALVEAGDRVAALGAVDEALRHYERALALTEEDDVRTRLEERAGRMALLAADADRALQRLAAARAGYERVGDRIGVLRVGRLQGDSLFVANRSADAPAVMEPAFLAATGDPTPELAGMAASIARAHLFADHYDDCLEWADQACSIAEQVGAWGALVLGVNYRGLALWRQGRPVEAEALLRLAVDLMERHDPPDAHFAPYNNLALMLGGHDPEQALAVAERGLEVCRRRGDRSGLVWLTAQAMAAHLFAGRWDEVERLYAELSAVRLSPSRALTVARFSMFRLFVERGELERAQQLYDEVWAGAQYPGDPEVAASRSVMSAMLLAGRDRHAEAVAESFRAVEAHPPAEDVTAFSWIIGCDSALRAGSAEAAARLLELAVGRATTLMPVLALQLRRFRARLAAAAGDEDAARLLTEVADGFAGIGVPFERARVQLEHGEWLVGRGHHEQARPLLESAREAFERLRATPYLTRVERAMGAAVSQPA